MDAARGPVILVVSPHAGHGAEQGAVATALRETGVEIGRVVDVSTLDEHLPQGHVWKSEGFAAAIAAGGDGTVGAVASHVAGSGVPLAILPIGTANDVARSLGVPLELDAACKTVFHGTVRQIDLGYCRPGQTEPGALAALAQAATVGVPAPQLEHIRDVASIGAYFVHTLTLGLNVEFARLATDTTRRRRLGPLNYAASAIQALQHFRPVPVEIRLEDVEAGAYGSLTLPEGETRGASGLSIVRNEATRTIAGDVVQFAAVVTPVFGGPRNFRIPDVSLTDQLIDFVVIEALEAHHLRTLFDQVHALFGAKITAENDEPGQEHDLTRLDLPGLWRFRARSARIIQPEGLDVTLDGEIRSRTPLEVDIAPSALSILLPEEGAEEDGRD